MGAPNKKGRLSSMAHSPMTVYIAAEILPTYNGSAVATPNIHKQRGRV